MSTRVPPEQPDDGYTDRLCREEFEEYQRPDHPSHATGSCAVRDLMFSVWWGGQYKLPNRATVLDTDIEALRTAFNAGWKAQEVVASDG